jgi:hypothetical protein
MVKTTQTVRFAAIGALALGLAFAGFAVSASADSTGTGNGNNTGGDNPAAAANGTGNGNTTGTTDAKAAAGADASADNAKGNDSAIKQTGEGALSTGPCYADMPVYNKEGKFLGRGLVNTCK